MISPRYQLMRTLDFLNPAKSRSWLKMRTRSGRRRRQQDPMRWITFQPRYRRRPNALLD